MEVNDTYVWRIIIIARMPLTDGLREQVQFIFLQVYIWNGFIYSDMMTKSILRHQDDQSKCSW
jgi:hypothetical protein